MVSDPEEANTTSPFAVASVLTSAHSDAVVLPVDLITGLNPFNLSAYGLRARWPTLRVQHYCCDPQGLATQWLAKPSEMGFSPTRLHGIARSLHNRRPDPSLPGCICSMLLLVKSVRHRRFRSVSFPISSGEKTRPS